MAKNRLYQIVVITMLVMMGDLVTAGSFSGIAQGSQQPLASSLQTEAPVENSAKETTGEASAADESKSKDAATNQIASKRLIEMIRSGGPLMVPIGICSFILLVFVFERAVALRKSRIIPRPFVKRFLQQIKDRAIDREAALERCEKNGSQIATVFAAGVKKWNKPSVEVEQAILDAGERTSNELRKYLRVINGVATVCPLLGLLGTVLGMIHAFDAIASVDPSQADPKLLIATGISQALLTTAAGMTVAIPAIIAYLYFVGCVDRRVMEIDGLGQELVHYISAEALTDVKTPRTRKTKQKVA